MKHNQDNTTFFWTTICQRSCYSIAIRAFSFQNSGPILIRWFDYVPLYEGVSNGNLKCEEIRIIMPLLCNLSIFLRISSVFCMCYHSAGEQCDVIMHNDSLTTDAPLLTCAKEKQHFVIRFCLSAEVWNLEIHSWMKVQYGDVSPSIQQEYVWSRKFQNGARSRADFTIGSDTRVVTPESIPTVVRLM